MSTTYYLRPTISLTDNKHNNCPQFSADLSLHSQHIINEAITCSLYHQPSLNACKTSTPPSLLHAKRLRVYPATATSLISISQIRLFSVSSFASTTTPLQLRQVAKTPQQPPIANARKKSNTIWYSLI